VNCVTLLLFNVKYYALYLVGHPLPPEPFSFHRRWHKLTYWPFCVDVPLNNQSILPTLMCLFFLQDLKNVTINEIDTSNGVMFIFYDPDTCMVYLCGKVCWFRYLYFLPKYVDLDLDRFILRPCQHNKSYLDGRSQIYVDTYGWTQVHSAESSLLVIHPSTYRGRICHWASLGRHRKPWHRYLYCLPSYDDLVSYISYRGMVVKLLYCLPRYR